MILLYNDTSTNSVVRLTEGKVAGDQTPARTYRQEGHFLPVDGPDHVMRHDVAQILRMPGYRLATAQEQQEFSGEKRQAGALKERNPRGGLK